MTHHTTIFLHYHESYLPVHSIPKSHLPSCLLPSVQRPQIGPTAPWIAMEFGGHDDKEEAAAKGRLSLMHLEGNVYSCKHCHTHLGLAADIISKAFHCKNGKAYLFSKVVNVTTGVKEDRMLITGMHTVSDIFCVGCGSIVGWKYEAAHEESQRYKEGKFILERFMLSGPDGSHDWVTHDAHVGGSDADNV